MTDAAPGAAGNEHAIRMVGHMEELGWSAPVAAPARGVGPAPPTARAHGRRASDPPTVLARAGARLLDAIAPDAVAEVAIDATGALLDRHGAGEVILLVVESGRLRPSEAAAAPSGAATGPPDAATARPDVALAELGAPIRTAMLAGAPFLAPAATFGRNRSGDGERLVVPLVSHGLIQGAIVADRSERCGRRAACACMAAVATLAVQVTLALESTQLLREAQANEKRFRSLVQHSSDITAVLARDGRLTYLSPAIERVLGHRPVTVQSTRLDAIVHPDDLPLWREFVARRMREDDSGVLQCRMQHALAAYRHVEVRATNLLTEPSVAGLVLNIRDVSERMALEADLTHLAYHDPLTNLPNRTLFFERVRTALADPARRSRMAVLFIDLDGFKAVNDRLGHAGGDELLVAVAQRLRARLAPSACVARLSGDEFAVLDETAPVIGQAEHAEQLARQLLAALDAPIRVQREEVRVRASIGVAVGANGVEDAGDILHRADLAMYAAKAAGKGRCTVFDLAAHETLAGQRQLRSELTRAFSHDQLEVRYQPLVSLTDGRFVSTEALVRWHHPQRGLLGPSAFIPLAEEEGLIGELFTLVLTRSCRQARRWQDVLGASAPGVAVNLSPRQLHEPGLVDGVVATLSEVGLDPGLLTLELTENVLLADPQAAARVMTALKDAGVRLAIDDFGTGFSSLAYLRALPLDILKVDKTFIDGLATRDVSSTLARTIIDLGHRLGLRTVGEGVETESQRDQLRELGCDYGQGYLFARPLLGGKVEELVRGQMRAGITAA